MKRSHPSLRWLMVALAFSATALNYLDRQTLSVTAPVLIDHFRMDHQSYSRVVFAFMLAYTIGNGISGPLLDRLGTRLGFALTMAWWSAAGMLNGLARGPWSLGVFQFLLGSGEAGNWPASVKVVAEWFPTEERALASGIFNSGSAAGAILAPPVVVWLLLHYGWRQAFVGVGLLGYIWIAIWCWLYYTPEGVRSEVKPPKVPLSKLLRTRFVWSFTLSKVLLDPVWYFYIFWFPEYLKSARHFSMASIGKYAWIPFCVGGLGNILGGGVSGWMLRRGMSLTVARKGGVTLFAVLMTSAIPAVLVADVRVSIAWVSLAMLGYTGCCSIMLAFPADVFPKNLVGSIWGIASMGAGLGGMTFALLTGWVLDHFSYVPVFVGFGLLPLVSAGLLWALLGPISTQSSGLDVGEAS
ncbi:MAG: MFS transporter [Terriglobia bacterium]|jgi:ACS family hexuronate transporter-like MFS transporter